MEKNAEKMWMGPSIRIFSTPHFLHENLQKNAEKMRNSAKDVEI